VNARVRRELAGVDPGEDDVGPGLSVLSKHSTAVLADVEVAAEPTVGRDIAREVPPSPTEIGDEHGTTRQLSGQRRETGEQHVLLVAGHDVRSEQLGENAGADWIEATPPDVPWLSDHADAECALGEAPVCRAKADQSRLDLAGHVARQLPHVPL